MKPELYLHDEEEYLPNIPRYIQDIVWIHNLKKTLCEEEVAAFEWYVLYMQNEYVPARYPQVKTILLD